MKINFFAKIENKFKISEVIELILKKRKIENIDQFLNPKKPKDITISDFGLEKEIKKTIKILKEIKEKNQMIVVYTDYDADGITGGAILWETLYLLGFKVMPYVPDRVKEGYGFSFIGIENVIKKFNPKLIISVDHGITKVKEVDYLKSRGIKVIITDHHLKGEKNPHANATFHIPQLSGAGVAYFFAKEIYNNFQNSVLNSQKKVLREYFEIDYLTLAVIGTIADLVPLIGPSRSLVKYGLESFLKTKRLGIRQILKEAGIEGKNISPYDIGFIIAPRINAVGRLKTALDALRLLCTKKEARAISLANHIGKINRQRQDLVEKSLEEAKREIKKSLVNDKLIILVSEKWHEGIIGLIAGKIAEEFYRPTIVLTKNDGFYKGSARSIPNFNITHFLRSLKKYLIDVGGHSQAAGFTIKSENLKIFKEEAIKKANQLIKKEDLEKVIEVDLQIPVSFVNLKLVKSIESLSPFGIGNPQPIFYSQGILESAKIFGKKNEHLRILIKDEDMFLNSKQSPDFLELIAFNQSYLFSKLYRGQTIKVIYTLEIDRWGEKEKVRGKILFILFP